MQQTVLPYLSSALFCCLLSPLSVVAKEQKQYSATLEDDYPKTVLWGDTHLHTNLSQDAFQFGLTLGPEEAYRFAKGGVITATHGQKAKLKRPLDFLVIADHAEGLGSMQMLLKGDAKLLASPRLQMWYDLLKKGDAESRQKMTEDARTNGRPSEFDLEEIRRPAWEQLINAATKYNEPGKFTALHGFEWSSVPGGSNLHRVVIFRDDADKVSKVMPYSYLDSTNPEDLWNYMENYEKQYQGKVLAIPHNGNLSNGLMFKPETLDEKSFDKNYVQRRASWEPVYEVTQIKGDGETHPLLSPNDEFADYESWDKFNLGGVPKTKEMIPNEYAREALKNGLAHQEKLGTNPFKFGMIGSTDSHTALSTPEEDNFYGKHSLGLEPSDSRMKKVMGRARGKVLLGWEQAASGYAAVWAKENTRASIWDALKRKEVYATTGSRITLRFFAGWDFNFDDANHPNLAKIGYSKGISMGGDLAAAPKGKAPKFLIAASRDPIGANLDRIQVIKGWLDSNGETQEQVYNVQWSDKAKRTKDSEGKLATVGNTVDVEKANYKNNIGSAQLSTVWQDPNFDSKQKAFYYVRVLEIPTPRWSTYDAVRFGTKAPEGAPLSHQERAYSSPIWYTPN